jgi:hypothetical protein
MAWRLRIPSGTSHQKQFEHVEENIELFHQAFLSSQSDNVTLRKTTSNPTKTCTRAVVIIHLVLHTSNVDPKEKQLFGP